MAPRGPLFKEKQVKTIELQALRASYWTIAKELDFSKSGIANFFKNPATYNEKERTGRP